MKKLLLWSPVVLFAALIFLVAWSYNRPESNWSWRWRSSNPFRYRSGQMISGLGPDTLRVDGRVYQFGPIVITHDWKTNRLIKIEEFRTAAQ